MKKNILVLSLFICVLFITATYVRNNVSEGITDFAHDSNGSMFQMVWHPGGEKKQENIPLSPGCFRVYDIELVPNPPYGLVNPLGPSVQYGHASFSDYGKTNFLCGVKKSSEKIVGYDEFFIDLNHNNQIEENEIFKGQFHESTMGPDVIDCHYGSVDLTLHDKEGTRTHRVFPWYHKLNASDPGYLYFNTQCYLDGLIKLGDKEIHVVLIDENCDGRYSAGHVNLDWLGDLGRREDAYDLIGWDVDGDGKIERDDLNFIGGCTLFDGKAYRIDCSEDGLAVTVQELKVPMGNLQMPFKNAYLKLIGELGPTLINISDGNIALPSGSYWVDYAKITGPDDYGDIVTLSKSGSYFEKPWQINTGMTTKIERQSLIVTQEDKNRYEDKIKALRASSVEPEYKSILNKPIGNIEELGLNLDNNTLKEKSVLLCFFDYQQRPSRNYVIQLNSKKQELKERNIIVMLVQTSKIDENILNEWLKENNISYSIGMIQNKEEQTRFNWSVKALPWLILTDKEHIVTAEGFSINELEDKIKE